MPNSFWCHFSSFSCTQKRCAELSLAAAGGLQKTGSNVPAPKELLGQGASVVSLQLRLQHWNTDVLGLLLLLLLQPVLLL